jgi:hypothetical protein
MANYDIVPASGFDHCAACNKKITKKAYKPKRSGLGGFLKSALLDNKYCSQSCLNSKHG